MASKEEPPPSLAWFKLAHLSDPRCWIHQSTGLRPLDPLTVSAEYVLTLMHQRTITTARLTS
jgi:hypothetical protein